MSQFLTVAFQSFALVDAVYHIPISYPLPHSAPTRVYVACVKVIASRMFLTICHVIRHTRIKLRCSDVTISHFSRLNFFLTVSPHTNSA